VTETFRALGWVLMSAGLLLVAWSALMVRRHVRQTQGWRSAEGKVVARETRQLTPGNPYYFPVIEFEVAEGTRQRFEATTGRWLRPDEVGDHVAVLYDPEQPSRAMLARFPDRWAVPAFVAGFGVMALVLGLMLISLTVPVPVS
jgi:hypothetical protein